MPNQQDDVNIRVYLRPLWRRRWLVLVIAVLTTAATYAYYENQPKDYQAKTQILLGAGGNPLDQTQTFLSDRDVQDLAGLLTSRDVAISVARQLGRPGQAGVLAGSIKTLAAPGSDFVEIKASQPSAVDAARVANAFARAFIQLRTDSVRNQITKSLNALQGQLRQLPPGTSNIAARQQLQDSIRQLQATAAVTSGSATQVDPAVPPAQASGPRPKRDAGLALVLSLIGAVALAYALQAFDRRPDQLEELAPLYGMPILTSMPHVSAAEFEDGHLAVDPALKEPLRQLRTNIQLAALDKPFKRLLITSAVAGEGKSTVVRNLAMVLSEGGLRVVIVDGDLRRPTLARVFGQRPEPGLTDVLTGSSPLEEALVTIPVEVHGLETLARMGAFDAEPQPDEKSSPGGESQTISLLPAGPEPADPQAVLSADRTRLLLEHLAAQYDIVLIDSPPLLHVTDAVALAPWVDAVIIVARLGKVTRESARRVPEMLARAGARPIGIVVNDVPVAEGTSYGYGYDY